MRRTATFRPKFVPTSLGVVMAAAAFMSCGDDDDDTGSTTTDAAVGGTTPIGGSGGTPATGGTPGMGGAPGMGGSVDSGGMAGAAGAGAGGEAGGPSAMPDPCRGIELPEDQHHVPPGMCARAVALDQGRLRQISFTSTGDLIGVRLTGEVLRYRDIDGDGMFSGSAEIAQIADTGGNGNNAHLDEVSGFLYAGTPDGVSRWSYASDTDDLGTAEEVVVGQPSSGTHTLHTTHVYDGWLYVHSGSENNLVFGETEDAYDTNRSVLKRFDLATFDPDSPFDWSEDGEVFVVGIRNMVGFTRNAAGEMYGVVNGADNLMYAGEDVHLDNPGERLIRLEEGGAHGYPFCFTAQHIETEAGLVDAGTQLATEADGFDNPHDDEWCAENSSEPLTFLQAHSAPLDITFYENDLGVLPAAWLGGAFVTEHGSWNTTPSVGHRVVFIPFDEDGMPPMPEATEQGTTFDLTVVFGGGTLGAHENGSWGWSNDAAGENPVRPVGVAVSPMDGALYISSDNAQVLGEGEPALQGVIYRVGLQPD